MICYVYVCQYIYGYDNNNSDSICKYLSEYMYVILNNSLFG